MRYDYQSLLELTETNGEEAADNVQVAISKLTDKCHKFFRPVRPEYFLPDIHS